MVLSDITFYGDESGSHGEAPFMLSLPVPQRQLECGSLAASIRRLGREQRKSHRFALPQPFSPVVERRLCDPALTARRPHLFPAGLLLGDQFAPILQFGLRHPPICRSARRQWKSGSRDAYDISSTTPTDKDGLHVPIPLKRGRKPESTARSNDRARPVDIEPDASRVAAPQSGQSGQLRSGVLLSKRQVSL
jgi:hypothetical protein